MYITKHSDNRYQTLKGALLNYLTTIQGHNARLSDRAITFFRIWGGGEWQWEKKSNYL